MSPAFSADAYPLGVGGGHAVQYPCGTRVNTPLEPAHTATNFSIRFKINLPLVHTHTRRSPPPPLPHPYYLQYVQFMCRIWHIRLMNATVQLYRISRVDKCASSQVPSTIISSIICVCYIGTVRISVWVRSLCLLLSKKQQQTNKQKKATTNPTTTTTTKNNNKKTRKEE